MNDLERVRSAPSSRVAALLGAGLTAGVVERLNDSPRFAGRLRAAAALRLGGLPELDARRTAALALDAAGLGRLVLGAGTIWHSAALSLVVERSARRRVAAALDGTHGLVAEARHLGREGHVDLPGGDLVEAATADGAACWAAWCAGQPPAVASRLSLLAGAGHPGPDHAIRGPAIVDWLLDRT